MKPLRAIRQPDRYTCGPTAMKMVAEAHGCGQGLSIKSIESMCGTNRTTGTTDIEMHKGLSGLGLAYVEHHPSDIATLRAGLENGSLFLLRTIIHGMKHWLVAAGERPDGSFDIFDPAGGRRSLGADWLETICRPRDWQMFEVFAQQDPSRFLSIKPLEGRWPAAIAIAEDTFESVAPRDKIRHNFVDASEALSQTLWIGEEMVGVYFLEKNGLPHMPPELKSLQGLGLAIKPRHRGRGYGSMLRSWPTRTGADYVWGVQLKTLNNIEDWKKRRIVFAKTPSCYITVEPVTPEAKTAVAHAMRAVNSTLNARRRRRKDPSSDQPSLFGQSA